MVIPIVFHNLSGYDGHFLIQHVAQNIEGSTTVIPCTMEKYISFIKHVKDTKIRLNFIDSFRFLNTSLDKLAGYLDKSDKVILKSQFKNDREFELAMRKGVFPYDYITSMDILNETRLA